MLHCLLAVVLLLGLSIGLALALRSALRFNKYHNSDGKLRFLTLGRYPRHTRYCPKKGNCFCGA